MLTAFLKKGFDTCSVVDPQSALASMRIRIHIRFNADPDPHYGKKLDPDLDRQYVINADPQHCYEGTKNSFVC